MSNFSWNAVHMSEEAKFTPGTIKVTPSAIKVTSFDGVTLICL